MPHAFFLDPLPVGLQQRGIRIDDQATAVGIQYQQVALGDDFARLAGSDHCRQTQAAREDRRMGRHAAGLEHQTGQVHAGPLLQRQHVSRRHVVRDQHQAFALLELARQHRDGRTRARQMSQHPLDHLPHVLRTTAEVLVVDRVELPAQLFELDRQRPFGVDQPAAHQIARRIAQQRVIQDHPVQIQERLDLARRFGRHRTAQLLEFSAHKRKRVVQTGHLVQHVATLDVVLLDVQLAGGQQMRAPDRNPARHAQSPKFCRHG